MQQRKPDGRDNYLGLDGPAYLGELRCDSVLHYIHTSGNAVILRYGQGNMATELPSSHGVNSVELNLRTMKLSKTN